MNNPDYLFFYCRCKEEFLKKDEMILNPKLIDRLCGFTMFIGELFLNLEVELAMWKILHNSSFLLSYYIFN